MEFEFEPDFFVQIKYDCPCHGYGWFTVLMTNVKDKATAEVKKQMDKRDGGCRRGLRVVNEEGKEV